MRMHASSRLKLQVTNRTGVQRVCHCELQHAVGAGLIGREDVTELGAVLAGTSAGRASDAEISVFDSTGLAIQDLAVALAALEQADELPDLTRFEL